MPFSMVKGRSGTSGVTTRAGGSEVSEGSRREVLVVLAPSKEEVPNKPAPKPSALCKKLRRLLIYPSILFCRICAEVMPQTANARHAHPCVSNYDHWERVKWIFRFLNWEGGQMGVHIHIAPN